jgi:uncharacterized protein YcnI
MRTLILATVVATFLATAAAAAAHVTVHPNRLPAGGFTTLVVRVPNETADAATTNVDVQLPPGFISVSTEPVPGWTAKLISHKLPKAVTMDGETHTTEVAEVVWSGGRIEPGQYLDFPLSVAVPDMPGTALTFKAIQTYDNGTVVRWIGDPSADRPAPQVAVTASTAAIADVPAGIAATPAASAAPSTTRANLGLGFGIAGLVAGLLALGLVVARRRSA